MRQIAGAAQSFSEPTILFVSSAFLSFLRHRFAAAQPMVVKQNCMFFFTVAAATVSHCRKQARVRV